MSIASVRADRLYAEYQRMSELMSGSDHRISFPHPTTPQPPENYRITLRCRGVRAVDSNGEPQFADVHEIEIKLAAAYPKDPPEVRAITPIWHPNIQHCERGLICINKWMARRHLDEVVEQVYDMVRYEPRVTNPEDPWNRQAVQWYRQRQTSHHGFFPLDSQPVRSGGLHGMVNIVSDSGPEALVRLLDEAPDLVVVIQPEETPEVDVLIF